MCRQLSVKDKAPVSSEYVTCKLNLRKISSTRDPVGSNNKTC